MCAIFIRQWIEFLFDLHRVPNIFLFGLLPHLSRLTKMEHIFSLRISTSASTLSHCSFDAVYSFHFQHVYLTHKRRERTEWNRHGGREAKVEEKKKKWWYAQYKQYSNDGGAFSSPFTFYVVNLPSLNRPHIIRWPWVCDQNAPNFKRRRRRRKTKTLHLKYSIRLSRAGEILKTLFAFHSTAGECVTKWHFSRRLSHVRCYTI